MSRQAAYIQRQPARRPVFARALIGQARLHQRIGQELLEVAGSLALHAGWDFLGAEFKQKIGHIGSGFRSGVLAAEIACRT
jgi:hypothetical protein